MVLLRLHAHVLSSFSGCRDAGRDDNHTAQDAPVSTSGTAELTAGPHDIRVRFQDRLDGGPRVYLYWTPPGGNRQVLPGSVLVPPPARAQ